MRMCIATVEEVYAPREVRTRDGWKKKFDIQTSFREPGYHSGLFETWNEWHAALCKRAKDTGTAVRVTWKVVPKFGAQIVNVEMVERVAA